MGRKRVEVDIEAYPVDKRWSFRLILDNSMELFCNDTYASIDSALKAGEIALWRLQHPKQAGGIVIRKHILEGTDAL